MREIPKVKPSMGAWERRVGGGRTGESGTWGGKKSSRRKERDDERRGEERRAERWAFLEDGEVSLPWPCGSLAWWFGTDNENHIARDYYTATVSATAAAAGAGEGYGRTCFFFFSQGECHTFLHPARGSLHTRLREEITRLPVCGSIWKNESFEARSADCRVCVVCLCCFWSGAELSWLLNSES